MKEVSKAKLSSLTQDPGGGAQHQPQRLNSSLQRMRDQRWRDGRGANITRSGFLDILHHSESGEYCSESSVVYLELGFMAATGVLEPPDHQNAPLEFTASWYHHSWASGS